MVAHLAKLSGMQKEVLSLYRGFLQAAQLKATVDRERIHSIVCVGYMFLHAVHILSFPFSSSATNLSSNINNSKGLPPFCFILCAPSPVMSMAFHEHILTNVGKPHALE